MADKRLFDLLKKALYRLGLITDFIVDGGGDDVNGYWVKFHSGKIVQWGEGGFAASSGRTTASVNFPVDFPDTNYYFFGQLKQNAVATVHCISESDGNANVNRTTGSTVVSCVKDGASYYIGFSWFAIWGGALLLKTVRRWGSCDCFSS